MATAEVIILSSSPRFISRAVSSSPSLPSPNFALRIPLDPSTFANEAGCTSRCLAATHSPGLGTIAVGADRDTRLDGILGMTLETPVVYHMPAEAMVARKRTKKVKLITTDIDLTLEEKKPRKKKGGETQSKLKAGKITKACNVVAKDKDIFSKKPRRRMPCVGKDGEPSGRTVNAEEMWPGQQIMEVIKQRIDLTPTNDTTNNVFAGGDDSGGHTGSGKSFGNLLETFGYVEDERSNRPRILPAATKVVRSIKKRKAAVNDSQDPGI